MEKISGPEFPAGKEEGKAFEKRNQGNLIVIRGANEELAAIGEKICIALHGGFLPKAKEYLLRGEELRPGGVYAVSLNGGELSVQNRNAFGDKGYNDKMLEAVKNIV